MNADEELRERKQPMSEDVLSTQASARRPKVVNSTELAAELGLSVWEVKRAQELRLIPPRDTSRGWTRPVADELAPKVAEIRETIADQESLGARRIAEEILAPATGLDVAAQDVVVLAEQNHVRVLGAYEGHPLYSVKDARAAAGSADVRAVLEGALTARREREARRAQEWAAWSEVSLPVKEAAERLGWQVRELQLVAAEERIAPGAGGRYAVADLDLLAADEEVCERIVGDRLIGAEAACGLLEIRHPTDWKFVTAAGWITPKTTVQSQVGKRRWIDVPLYATRDVEALREVPGVDWEEVRATPPGKPSPLREFAAPGPSRAESLHAFAGALADRHAVTVWAVCDERTGTWELDWTHNAQGGPSPEEVSAALRQDTQAGRYSREVRVGGSRWAARSRWAAPLLEPGAAVLLATRAATVGQGGEPGGITEVAVVDPVTGDVLLDQLVRGAPSAGEGELSEQERTALAATPTWERVLPKVRDLTRGRVVIACHPTDDRARIEAATRQAGKRMMHLDDADVWTRPPGEQLDGYAWGPTSRERCGQVRETLLRLARGRGRAHTPAA
jgi:hypothetical protein